MVFEVRLMGESGGEGVRAGEEGLEELEAGKHRGDWARRSVFSGV